MIKRRLFRKPFSMLLVSAMVFSLFAHIGIREDSTKSVEAAAADVTTQLQPGIHSVFHDTNGDGWGEFEGWGTSLCWWANRIGYDRDLTSQAAKLFFDAEDGLGMTIGRYNIGGGDDPSHDHIRRSDSIVPGYAVDVTKITSVSDAEGFDQYDLECGYAWNYDWDIDSNQLNVLAAVSETAGTDFIGEAFSNSPPYFMTNSGCSSGNGSSTNIREDSYKAFAKYLADVTKHLIDEGYPIYSIAGMNEPSNGWAAYNNKQEGCYVARGEDQSKVITTLSDQLAEVGLNDLIISGCDETGIDKTCAAYRDLTLEAKNAISRIDTHTYAWGSVTDLRELAETEGKNLWMSEKDGSNTAGINAGDMSAALGLSNYIRNEVTTLMPSAWILWNALDIHVDAENQYDADSLGDCGYSELDKNGFWGLGVADHNNKQIMLTKKYYAFGQYSRYIRPGYTMISTDSSTVAAYDKNSETAVVVVANTKENDQTYQIDLSQFGSIKSNASVKAVRTSGDLATGENWADVSKDSNIVFNQSDKMLSTVAKANSITTYIISGVSLDRIPNVKPNQYTVTFNANGGNKLTGSSQFVKAGEKLTYLPTVQRKKYLFNGWYTAKTGGTKVSAGQIISKNITLYAHWKKVSTGKVTIKFVKSKKTKTATISWKKVKGAKGYVIFYGTKKTSLKRKVVLKKAGTLKKTIKKLKKKKRYYFKVKAYRLDSTHKKVYGTCKKTVGVKIK